MKYGKLVLERLKEPENSIETWMRKVKDDPEAVRKQLEGPFSVSDVWPISARQALEEYEKDLEKQKDELELRRHEREEEALKVATEANGISRNSNILATIAICLSIVAIVVSVFVAVVQK